MESAIARETLEHNDNPFGYPQKVWELFSHAPRAGSFAAAQSAVRRGSAGTRASGARLQLEFLMDGERVADARFRAFGCPSSIAVGAWIADWSIGRTQAELATLTAAALRSELEIAEDRAHCALMGEDALRDALSDKGSQR